MPTLSAWPTPSQRGAVLPFWTRHITRKESTPADANLSGNGEFSDQFKAPSRVWDLPPAYCYKIFCAREVSCREEHMATSRQLRAGGVGAGVEE